MKSRYLACVLLLLGLATSVFGCKGDGGDGGDGGGDFLTVLQTAPQDGAQEAPVESRIGFQIDQPIDASTLTSDTFFVTDENGETVEGTRVVLDDDENAAELVVEQPLAVITNYTVTVTTGLRSQSGSTLEENYEWDFKTLDSEWGLSAWIEEPLTGTSSGQEIVVDGQLNALAVWERQFGDGSSIWANRYTRTELWGEPQSIDSGTGGASQPSLAVDDAGNGFAVWKRSQDGGLTANIWTNRYDVEQQAWGTAELLQDGKVTKAVLPLVTANPAGNAIATWVQSDVDTGDNVVWSRRYESGIGWSAAALIGEEAPTSPLVRATELGNDANGNALALWTRPTVMGDVIWANRYTADIGWGTAAPIKADPNTSVREMRLSVGRGGDAVVVWRQGDGVRDDIWSARFSGSSWAAPVRIDNYDGGGKSGPDVAVDGSGVAHAVWSQADPVLENFYNIWATQYTPGAGWGTPKLIEPPSEDPQDDGTASSPRIGTNSAGNTFVVWVQVWDKWASVWSNRLDPGTGWMTAERIEEIARPARAPKIAVDENRHGHALWLHYVDIGFDWVRTNRFE